MEDHVLGGSKPQKTPTQIMHQSESKPVTEQDALAKPSDVTLQILNSDQAEMERLLDEKMKLVETRFMSQLNTVETKL
jgi:hypothetical protein|tara:strand:+ start:583 stop:816 length:234 start_codon:yes stop_codon:yes gene_type:complete